MDNLDCIISIGIHTDFNKTILLAQTCSYIHKNIWKLKLKYYFPNKKYFDFWTGSQNYLVYDKKIFMIGINFGMEYIDNRIYESSKMLQNIMEDYKTNNDEFIRFEVNRRFILIRYNHSSYAVLLVGQYDSKKRALISAKKNQELVVNKNSVSYSIVDLKMAVLKFWKIYNYNIPQSSQNKIATFYNGNITI